VFGVDFGKKRIFLGEYVLLSVYFGEERSTWDYMDSCTFREEAPKESGG